MNYVDFVVVKPINNGCGGTAHAAALCKRTRQIVGYVIGDRSELTFSGAAHAATITKDSD